MSPTASETAVEDQVAEQSEHGSVDRHPIEYVGEPVGVQLGQSVVCLAQLVSPRVNHPDKLANPAAASRLNSMARET